MSEEKTIIFEAATQAEANRQADEWWSKQKGLRLVHRSQVSDGFTPGERWIVTIDYVE